MASIFLANAPYFLEERYGELASVGATLPHLGLLMLAAVFSVTQATVFAFWMLLLKVQVMRIIGNYIRRLIVNPSNTFNLLKAFYGFFKHVFKFDEFVKSPTTTFTVIPAKAGIQPACACPHADRSFQIVADHLDSGFHRSDDFLRIHQI